MTEIQAKAGPDPVDAAGEFTTIPAAGEYFWGVGRNSSYAMASDGTIPTVTVGRKKLVPIRVAAAKRDQKIDASAA